MTSVSFTVRHAEVNLLVSRVVRDNGAERIYSALIKAGFWRFEMCFKVTPCSKWAVSSKNMIE